MDYTLEEKYELIKKNLLNETSKNPLTIAKHLMHMDFINIHGPEHHFLDGACFMTALKNTGLSFDSKNSIDA